MHPDIRILSVATRPDCLGEDILNLLHELNQIKPVWIELGNVGMNMMTKRSFSRIEHKEIAVQNRLLSLPVLNCYFFMFF